MTLAGTVTAVLLLVASLVAVVVVVVICVRRVQAAFATAQAAVERVQERAAALDDVRAVTIAERAALDERLAALRVERDTRRHRGRGSRALPSATPYDAGHAGTAAAAADT